MKAFIRLLVLPAVFIFFIGCKKEDILHNDLSRPTIEKKATTNGEITEWIDEFDENNMYSPNVAEEDFDYLVRYVPITYSYRGRIIRNESDRQILYMEAYPITADPMVSVYIDKYGRSVTRRLTLYNHFTLCTPLTPTSCSISWSCTVHARYSYTDGTPEWTRAWNDSKQKIYF